MSEVRVEASRPPDRTPLLADRRRRSAFEVGALALLVACVIVCVVPGLTPARPGILLLGFCLIPGCAVLTRLDVDGVAEAATLAIVLGLSLLTAGSLAMVWTGWWHPFAWGIAVAGASATVLLSDLVSGARSKWR